MEASGSQNINENTCPTAGTVFGPYFVTPEALLGADRRMLAWVLTEAPEPRISGFVRLKKHPRQELLKNPVKKPDAAQRGGAALTINVDHEPPP